LLEVVFIYVGAGLSLAAAAWAVLRLGRTNSSQGRGPEAVLVLGLVSVVAFLVTREVKAEAFPAVGLCEALALFSVAVGVCYLALVGRAENIGLGAFVLPIGATLAAASAAMVPFGRAPAGELHNVLLALHVSSLFGAYGAFAFGSGAGIAYLLQERALRRKKLGTLSARLPSLSTLDTLSYHAVALGFPLLTFGIATGSFWAARTWGSYWFWEPKLTLALLLWLLGAAIFHLRTVEKYQGRRTALLTIASGLMVLIVFLVPSLFAGGHHGFL